MICFFFLYRQQRTQSNISSGAFLLTANSCQLFLQKSCTRLLVEFEIRLLVILSKKQLFKQYFPSYVKLFCLCSYHAYLILFHKSEKGVTERNKRLKIWSLSINCETQFFIPPNWIIENDFCQILCEVLRFFVKRREIGLFFTG